MARRSTSRSTSSDKLVVGVIRGPHGVAGDVRVAPHTDNPERLLSGAVIELEGVGARRITRRRGTAREPILHLEGVDDREAAAALAGRALFVALVSAREVASGYLWADLVGLRVEDEAGGPLGTLAEVLRPGGGVDVFVVRDAAGTELLLPAIESVVRMIDVAAGRVVVRPQEEA